MNNKSLIQRAKKYKKQNTRNDPQAIHKRLAYINVALHHLQLLQNSLGNSSKRSELCEGMIGLGGELERQLKKDVKRRG